VFTTAVTAKMKATRAIAKSTLVEKSQFSAVRAAGKLILMTDRNGSKRW